jgi:hypothetical protein
MKSSYGLAMIAGWKAKIGMTLGCVLVVLVYELHQQSVLRNKIESLEKRQASLSEQAAGLQFERDDATNRLGMLGEENKRLQLNASEILKLRAEVTRLNGSMRQEKGSGRGEALWSATRTDPSSDESFDDRQKKFLAQVTEGIKTKNSVADLDRLKDTLARWDELVPSMFPSNMNAVLPILKERVRERIAELEEEKQKK